MRKLVVLMAVVVVLGGCGGGGGGSARQKWDDKNAENVATFSEDLDAAQAALTNGDRQTILRSCTQLSVDVKDFRPKAIPVPNPAVDAPLRTAFDKSESGATDCLAGSRVSDAAALERAIPTLREARGALDTAQAAIKTWV